jgi:CheY-like chemotaxis protein
MAGETVLIVEDRRENIVHLANNILKPNGYRVITAMDGQRGLQRALEDRPDLIILDLNMPKMDGLEVLTALNERRVHIPVILSTFYGSEQVAEQALRLGAVDYVVKPFTVEAMLAAVERALAARPRTAPRPEPEEALPLTRQVERWMRDMNILNRIGKALVTGLDRDRACRRAIEAAIYITRADHAFLFLKTGNDDDLCLCATRGPGDQQVRAIEQVVDSNLAQQVARSGTTLRLKSAQTDPALVEAAGELLGPVIGAPLRCRKETLGVLLAVRSPGETAFGESDLEWLSGLAEYVAIAVHNARRCQERAAAQPPSESEDLRPALQSQVDQLAAALQAANEAIERLATLLAREDR